MDGNKINAMFVFLTCQLFRDKLVGFVGFTSFCIEIGAFCLVLHFRLAKKTFWLLDF